MQAKLKMKVMFSSPKKKMETFATAVSEAFRCPVSAVPPPFPCDKERLVVIGMTIKDEPDDNLRLFCRELTAQRAINVALFVDGEKDAPGIQVVKDLLTEAGTHVIDDVYYVDGGKKFSFSKKITLEERTAIVKWVEGIADNL